VRTIDVGIGHNDDSAIAQFAYVKISLVFPIAVLFRFTDTGTDSSNHRLNLVVLEKLIDARLFDID
jgi:hypothetical protein